MKEKIAGKDVEKIRMLVNVIGAERMECAAEWVGNLMADVMGAWEGIPVTFV